MFSKAEARENIELSMPVNAAYVSAVRLTASSIANRLQFDIDEIEDIKAAVSEACTYIIKKAAGSSSPHDSTFKINFLLYANSLEIKLNINNIQLPPSDHKEMSLVMIEALMDDTSLDSTNRQLVISMHKKHKENEFKGI